MVAAFYLGAVYWRVLLYDLAKDNKPSLHIVQGKYGGNRNYCPFRRTILRQNITYDMEAGT